MLNPDVDHDDFHPAFGEAILCHSDTAKRCGLDNVCPAPLKDNLRRLSRLLGQIESMLPDSARLCISSGFRSTALNEKVGGVENSQHTLGQAADIACPAYGTPYSLACAIRDSGLEFDQLIIEFNRWVHVSVPSAEQPARRQCLSIFNADEGYLEGLIER